MSRSRWKTTAPALKRTTSASMTVRSQCIGEILPVDDTLDNVFPTWSKNTTVVVRLSEGATVADSGSFTITVTEPDSELNSSITVLVTVAPAYHPSLSGAQNGPVAMAAGASTTLAFNAHNLGTVTDTLLLDVEVEPDLSGWWANQTSNNSNNTNNSGNTTPTTSISVLMYGNSYTNYNNLGSMVESMIDAAGYNGSVTAPYGGGMMLSGHWQNVNTSGHQWNTTLRTQTTDSCRPPRPKPSSFSPIKRFILAGKQERFRFVEQ